MKSMKIWTFNLLIIANTNVNIYKITLPVYVEFTILLLGYEDLCHLNIFTYLTPLLYEYFYLLLRCKLAMQVLLKSVHVSVPL